MAKVGRNDPCPCGSGKKYKQCCLKAEQVAQGDSDRAMQLHEFDQQMVERLLRFASREFGSEWIKELVELLDGELDSLMAPLVIPGAVYDWASEDGTILELFIESSPRVTPRERIWIEAQRRAGLSVWEVQDVAPGVAITVRDLFTGEERRVLERGASRTLVARDCVLARVVDFEGVSVFCGMHPRNLTPRPAAVVVAALRKTCRFGSKNVSVDKLRESIPFEGWFLTWQTAVNAHDEQSMQLPKMQNTDGDPLLMTKDRFAFDPSDRARLQEELAEIAEPEADDADVAAEQVFLFFRAGNAMHKSWDNTVVGRGVVRKDQLILETNSVRRADDLRAKIEAALKVNVRHRIREHQDPVAMLRAAGESSAPIKKAEPTPPAVIEALRELKRRHMEDWLDTPIPALAGLTPREAALKPRKRNDLVLMLKEIENYESRAPENERMDVSMLYTELGLREASR